MTFDLETVEQHRTFDGTLHVCRHASAATGTPMTFSVYVPDGGGPFPVLTWLSGLTCTHDNFTVKAGAYGVASQLKMIIAAPDTSPRGGGVADDEGYDLGQGAGFYVNATQEPWAPHFKMYDYITQDLQQAVFDHFPGDKTRQGISGHSMGGHGALTIALKNPDLFKSVSAFAPIVAPASVPWGQKALTAYLGADQKNWQLYDTTLLLNAGVGAGRFDGILVDVGTADPFLEKELKPELLEAACQNAGQKLTLRHQPGYDHSYFFITTFIADHLRFHAQRL